MYLTTRAQPIANRLLNKQKLSHWDIQGFAAAYVCKSWRILSQYEKSRWYISPHNLIFPFRRHSIKSCQKHVVIAGRWELEFQEEKIIFFSNFLIVQLH